MSIVESIQHAEQAAQRKETETKREATVLAVITGRFRKQK